MIADRPRAATKSLEKSRGTPIRRAFQPLPPVRGRCRLVRETAFRGRRGGDLAAGEPLDRGAHGLARAAVAHRIEQRRRRARAPDQDFRIGQHQRIVPRPLHHEGQFERRAAVGRGRADQARNALEVEIARRDRGLAREREFHRRAFERRGFDGGVSVAILSATVNLSNGVRPRAEFAAAGQRAALQPAQQLLEIESRSARLAARSMSRCR